MTYYEVEFRSMVTEFRYIEAANEADAKRQALAIIHHTPSEEERHLRRREGHPILLVKVVPV